MTLVNLFWSLFGYSPLVFQGWPLFSLSLCHCMVCHKEENHCKIFLSSCFISWEAWLRNQQIFCLISATLEGKSYVSYVRQPAGSPAAGTKYLFVQMCQLLGICSKGLIFITFQTMRVFAFLGYLWKELQILKGIAFLYLLWRPNSCIWIWAIKKAYWFWLILKVRYTIGNLYFSIQTYF